MDAPKPAKDVDEVANVEAEAPRSRVLSDPTRDDPDREARWAKWRTDNAAAIDSSNAWVERNGLPLAKYRVF